MRLRTWTGLAGGEKKASVFLNRHWLFLYCFLSCMIKLYNLRGFLRVPCAFPIFTQYQNDLCPTQLSILLPISLCILSGEGSVAGNLIILSSAVDALVESHVLNWFWSCSINLSKTPKAWFHLISDGVKTIDVSSWEMVVIAAQRLIVFIIWLGFLELACGEQGDVEISFGGVCEVSSLCFYSARHVFFFFFNLSLCPSLWSILCPICLLRVLKRTLHDSAWLDLTVIEDDRRFKYCIEGSSVGGQGEVSNGNCGSATVCLSLP